MDSQQHAAHRTLGAPVFWGLIIVAIYFVNLFPYKGWTFSGLLLIATAASGYCPIYSFLQRRKDGAVLLQK